MNDLLKYDEKIVAKQTKRTLRDFLTFLYKRSKEYWTGYIMIIYLPDKDRANFPNKDSQNIYSTTFSWVVNNRKICMLSSQHSYKPRNKAGLVFTTKPGND